MFLWRSGQRLATGNRCRVARAGCAVPWDTSSVTRGWASHPQLLLLGLPAHDVLLRLLELRRQQCAAAQLSARGTSAGPLFSPSLSPCHTCVSVTRSERARLLTAAASRLKVPGQLGARPHATCHTHGAAIGVTAGSGRASRSTMDSVTFLPSMSYVRPLWSICVRTQRGEMSPARARHNTMAHNQARRCAAHNCKAALHHARADGFLLVVRSYILRAPARW